MSKGHRTLRDPRSFVASASGIKMIGHFGLRDQDDWSLRPQGSRSGTRTEREIDVQRRRRSPIDPGLGGSSEIGLAITEEYLKKGRCGSCWPRSPAIRRLPRPSNSSRPPARRRWSASTSMPAPRDPSRCHRQGIRRWGHRRVSIVAFGIQGDDEQAWQDQKLAVAEADINYTAAVSVGVLLGQKLRAQGFGQIIAMSSVAGERVRRSNFVYGSTRPVSTGSISASVRRCANSVSGFSWCVPEWSAPGCRRTSPRPADHEQRKTWASSWWPPPTGAKRRSCGRPPVPRHHVGAAGVPRPSSASCRCKIPRWLGSQARTSTGEGRLIQRRA